MGGANARHGNDQGTAGRGEKPGEIPPIEESRARRDRSSPTAKAFPWDSKSAAPTPTMCDWPSRPSRAFPSDAPSPHAARSNTCALIRLTTRKRYERWFDNGDTRPISNHVVKKKTNENKSPATVRGDGSTSARNLGSTDFADFLSVGRRSRKTILACCILHVLGSPTVQQRFLDRL